MKHYVMNRDEVFQKAIKNGVKKGGAESGAADASMGPHRVTGEA